MAVHDLYPGFVKIAYHSPFGPHTMTIPTKQPSFSAIGDNPTYVAWDGSTISAGTMVNLLIDKIKLFVTSDTVVDGFVVYNVPSRGAEPQPVYASSYGGAGSNTLTGWSEAVQRTYYLRTSLFNAFKWVMLDIPTDNTYAKFRALSSQENAVMSQLIAPTNAWSGRDEAQPSVFVSLTITLNQRLRRSYKLR